MDLRTVSASVRVRDVKSGCARKRTFPRRLPVHSNSCPGAEVSEMPEPILKASQRLRNAFQSSHVEFYWILGRMSFGSLWRAGAGTGAEIGLA